MGRPQRGWDMRPDTHYCPAPGCALRVPNHKLMCPNHWSLVPEKLRLEVLRTWNALLGNSELQPVLDYRLARQEAVDFVIRILGGATS